MADFNAAALPGQDRYGAVVTGLQPEMLGDPATRKTLYDLWIGKGVVVFKNMQGGTETQLALSEIFGDPEIHPMMTGTNIQSGHKALAPIDYDRDSGNLYEVKGKELGGYLPWHFDSAYVDRINHGGILRPEILPNHGGDTGFLDQISAYDTLPQTLRDKIEGLNVLYAYQPDLTKAKFGDRPERIVQMSELFKSGMKHPSVQTRVIHPLVYAQAGTGRKVLRVSPWFAEGIEGMENAEGDALLKEVISYVMRPELMYFHKWEMGDMVLWDNWRMLHCATGVPANEIRKMRRTTIAGDYGLGRKEMARVA